MPSVWDDLDEAMREQRAAMAELEWRKLARDVSDTCERVERLRARVCDAVDEDEPPARPILTLIRGGRDA